MDLLARKLVPILLDALVHYAAMFAGHTRQSLNGCDIPTLQTGMVYGLLGPQAAN